MTNNTCRFCNNPLNHTFVDLGMSPLANSYLDTPDDYKTEPFFPLHVFVCDRCFLVQLMQYESPDNMFGDYAYFSSFSETWLQHAKNYTEEIIQRFQYTSSNLVIEIASNDGYLLKNFKERGIPILGIEPAANVARVAEEAGVPTRVQFFGSETAQQLKNEGKEADLLLGNNVLAHVPDVSDFVKGLKILLKPDGVITMEFPHVLRMIEDNQFDTIYQEHFSYFSLYTVEKIFNQQGLDLFDAQELPTHGGSLRIFARHRENKTAPPSPRLDQLRQQEIRSGVNSLELYQRFTDKVQRTKANLLNFLNQQKRESKKIVGYGAPAKGNTLLNFCEINTNYLEYTVDRSPHKQGKLLPGTHIPIHAPEKIREDRPDFIFILPWNIKSEIIEQMSYIAEWGGQFFLAIPELEIISP